MISDYTREAEKPVKATAVSVIVYGLVSCWMYVIGMGGGNLYRRDGYRRYHDEAGLGIAGLLIVIFSTVTTTFLDAYSAGVSSESILPAAERKACGNCCYRDRHDRSDPLPHGRHHGFPLSDRFRVRAHDSGSDRRRIYPEKRKRIRRF